MSEVLPTPPTQPQSKWSPVRLMGKPDRLARHIGATRRADRRAGAEATPPSNLPESDARRLSSQSQYVPASLDHQAHLVQHVAPQDGVVPSVRPMWTALGDSDADAEGERSASSSSV